MSRRTKLIITALFLVLLAIPAVYHRQPPAPKNPLRFHVVWEPQASPQSYQPNSEEDDLHTLILENVSASPVYFMDAIFVSAEDTSLLRSMAGSYTKGTLRANQSMHSYRVISPGGYVRIQMNEHQHAECVFAGQEWAHYAWASPEGLQSMETRLSEREKWPLVLEGFVPRLAPYVDAAPITVMTKSDAEHAFPTAPRSP